MDQQVIDLYRSEGFQGSFADASRIIYGQEATQPAQQSFTPNQEQVEASEPDPINGIDKQADDIRATILELEGKVEKAAEELETTEALKLQREIMKQELQLQTLSLRKQQMEREREQAVYQTHRTKAMESRDRVYERYPDLQNKDSVLGSSSTIMYRRLRTIPTTPQSLTHQNGQNLLQMSLQLCIRHRQHSRSNPLRHRHRLQPRRLPLRN